MRGQIDPLPQEKLPSKDPALLGLTIHTRKNLCFTEFSTKILEIQSWLLLTFLICLHNQLSSFNSIIVQMSEKRDSSNRQ